MHKTNKEISILKELKEDLFKYTKQRDGHHANLNQVIGAIFATEEAIKKIESKDHSDMLEQ